MRHTKRVDEELIWRVLECVAASLAVLIHGNEMTGSHDRSPSEQPIAHFDVKPDNSESKTKYQLEDTH